MKYLLPLLLCSCTIKPFITNFNGREVVSLGGSFATKSNHEIVTITKPDGTIFSYETEAQDETIVPNNYLKGKVLVSALNNSASVSKAAIKTGNPDIVTPVLSGVVVGAGVSTLGQQQQIPLPVMQARR